MVETPDLILPRLREKRAENAVRHGDVMVRFDHVERRLRTLDDSQGSFEQALSAESLLGKHVTGRVEERVDPSEKKVRVLEGRIP